jgi:type IV fimbrial biogenesis protein FimT
MNVGRPRSGFTLLELMTVIALIAIIAAIAIPNYFSWLPKHRLARAAQQTLSALRLARLTAVKENALVTVRFDRRDRTYLAFVDNSPAGAGDGIQEAGERTLFSGMIPPGILFESTSVDFFPFNSRGLFHLPGGSVVLKSAHGTKTVVVAHWGRIRIDSD